MTWTLIGTPGSTTAATFTAAPGATGNLIPIMVICESATVTPTGITSTNATWTKVASATGVNNPSLNAAWFLGKASSASSATATIAFSGTKPTTRAEFCQYHSSVGSWVLDASAVLDSAAGTNTWPAPGGASGDLQLGFAFNNGSTVNGTNGTPAGMVYTQDANANGFAYNLSQVPATAAVWGDSTQAFGLVISVAEGSGTVTSTGSASMASMAAHGTGASGPAAYSLWSQATETWSATGVNPGTIGVEVSVSQGGTLAGVWLYSPSGQGLTSLPTTIGLYTVSGTTLVTSQTPSWSGAAGSGWVYAAFSSPPALTASTNYMLVAYGAAASFGYDSSFTWPVTTGPVTGVNGGYYATAGSLAYPSSQQTGWNWWLDVSFVPATVTSTGSASMATMTATGSGTEKITSTGSASLASMAAHGSGASGTGVIASGSASLATMAAAGTGSAPVIATGSASLTTMAAHGSGSETIPATGSASMSSMTATGTGTEKVSSTGSASLTGMTAAGTGTETVPATGSASLATMSAGGTGAAPVIATGGASLASMSAHGTSGSGTVNPAGTWTGSHAVTSGYYFPSPSAIPVQVPITNTPGDWLFALVAWRPSTTGSGVSVCVADDAHNWWEPLGAPAADSDAAGVVRTAVWAAPAARVANSVTGITNVQAAATGPVVSMAVTIVDMNGLLPWYQVTVITGDYANAATTLALSSAAPSSRALLFAAFGSDNNAYTVTGPTGWTPLTGTSAGNGVDHTADIKLTPAWQVVTGSTTASLSSGGSLDLAGVIAGVLVSAPQPAQPNPNWPVMVTEAAIGSGVQTPPSEMTWTPLSGRSLALRIQQGKQYSLGQLQAGQGTITLDDPDGALIPPGTGAYAGIDSGTPLRRRVTWPGLPGSPNLTPNYVAFSGYFRRWPWNMDAAMLRGQVIAEISDVWAYGNAQLNSMAIQEALLDNPHSLWPLTDPAGSTGAGNLVTNGAPLPLTASKYGAGGATVAWGGNSGALVGMSAAKVTASGTSGGASGMFSQTLAGLSLGANGYGYALVAYDPSFPAISAGVTVEAWAQFTGTVTSPGGIVFVAAASNSQFTLTTSIAAGSAVVLAVASGFTFPGGFTAGVTYYVIGTGSTTVQLSATPGGSAITVTSDGDGYIQVTVPWDPVISSARDGKGGVFGLSIRGSDGALLLLHRSGTAVAATVVSTTGQDYRAGGPYHFSLAVTRAAWRVIVDGGAFLAVSGTFSPALPAAFRTLCYGGVQDATEQGYALSGYVALAGVYPGFSPQVRVVNRYLAAGGMADDGAQDRVERLLEYAGLTGRRWLGQQVADLEGDLVASGQDIGGQAAVSSINNIVQSTLPAYASVTPTGDIVYRSKEYVWNEPVRWVLGDNVAAGEIPFAPGSMATDYDPSRVSANVQLTQLDTQAVTVPSGVMSAATMADVAATAAGQYGGAAYQQTGYLQADWSSPYSAGGSLVDLANWVQAVYARPANRIQAVTVDAASHPAAWPFWCAAAGGDMVTVNVRLPTAATSPLISLTARITQTARASQFGQDGTSATITATLDFAPEYQALTCDDPVRGLLNGTCVMPW